MAKTRGVFALINDNYERLLVSERADGKGWNLPGGRVEENESDEAALVREVLEELGIKVEVCDQVGVPLEFKEDTAIAYRCRIIEGEPKNTEETKSYRYVTSAETKDMMWAGLRTYCMVLTSFYVKTSYWKAVVKTFHDGISMTSGCIIVAADTQEIATKKIDEIISSAWDDDYVPLFVPINGPFSSYEEARLG